LESDHIAPESDSDHTTSDSDSDSDRIASDSAFGSHRIGFGIRISGLLAAAHAQAGMNGMMRTRDRYYKDHRPCPAQSFDENREAEHSCTIQYGQRPGVVCSLA
jgi:hypothetical protein